MRAFLFLVVLYSINCHPVAAAPVARMAEPRASHGASLLDDGTVLVTGGFRKAADGYSQLYASTTELFDPQTNAVLPGPRMHHARAGHVTATLRDGSILVAGGWDEHGPLRSAELFEPKTRRFVEIGQLSAARGGATATRLPDGRVAVIGGGDDRKPLATIEIYDPATRRWRAAGTLTTPRAGHTATLLPDGRILVIGGAATTGQVLTSVELYDPRTERAVLAGDMAIPRYKHAAVLLPTGAVLVIGGSDARDWKGKHATTELYDPRTGVFRPGPNLAVPRFKLPHAVAMLANGDIILAGGAPTIEVLHGATLRTPSTPSTPGALGTPGTPDTLDIPDALDASYYSTATRLPSDELVVIGGYDDRLRATTAISRFRR